VGDSAANTILRLDVTPDARVCLYARRADGEGSWTVAKTPPDSLPPGKWSFVAVRLENAASARQELTIRINDAEFVRAFQANDERGTAAQLGPGHGVIDEVAVFKRALSDREIQAVYEAGVKGKSPAD